MEAEGRANLEGAYTSKGLMNEEGGDRDRSLGLTWESWGLGRARQDKQEGNRKRGPCLAEYLAVH